MFQNIKEKMIERGFSLVEVMVSAAILGTVFITTLNSVSNFLQQQSILKSSEIKFEQDELFRFEIGTTLKHWHQAITIESESPTALNSGDDDMTTSCSYPVFLLALTQGMYSGGRSRGFVIWWNERRNVLGPSTGHFFAMYNRFFRNRDRAGESFTDVGSEEIIEAMKRCDENAITQVGKLGLLETGEIEVPPYDFNNPPDNDIKDSQKVYMCGFGNDGFFELSVFFWDFLKGAPVACKDNRGPGRGLKVFYKNYFMKFRASSQSETGLALTTKTTKGSLNISKSITTQAYIQQVWE